MITRTTPFSFLQLNKCLNNNKNNNNANFIYLVFFSVHKIGSYHIYRQAARLWCKPKNTHTEKNKNYWKVKLAASTEVKKSLLAN